MRRIPVVIAIGSTLCLTAPTAHALGFGRVDNTTVLGQPLDFSAVISGSSAGEPVDGECLSAEVFAGDNKLPPPLVRIRLEQHADGRQAAVRITTTVRIDEPIVTVNLMVGCPVKLSRRFVAFVDPPVIALPRATVASIAPTDSEARADPQPDAPPTTAAPLPIQTTPPPPPPQPAASEAARARPPKPQTRRPAGTVVATAAVRPKPAAATPRSAGAPASAAASAAGPTADAAASAPARLVLDSAPLASGAAPISAAASAILTAELESYAQELAVERQRMKALEASIDRMRQENEATRTSLAKVQSQLNDSDSVHSPLLRWFYGLIALLVAVIGGLLWRQSRMKRQAQWWADSRVPSSATAVGLDAVSLLPEPSVPPLPVLAPLAPLEPLASTEPIVPHVVELEAPATIPASTGPLPMRDAPPSRPRGTATQFDTQPMPPGTFIRPQEESLRPTRELSVEELIDIEQQADFFVVLGQDDSAIDLLMGLIRSSGGQTPMPYLKLLEIYRRLDRSDAHERIRERFNQRFNAVAPPMDVDPQLGLDLSGYPDALGRLQAAWGQPRQVLTMLERLMPKTSGDGETFDLEAFAELLFLERIARDLSDLESGEHGVDFLLPLDMDPLIQGPATLSLHAPYEPHKPMVDLTLDLDLGPMR